MIDYESDSEDVTEIVIPEGVTHISEGALDRIFDFKRLVLPDSLTSIEESVFFLCDTLLEFAINENNKVYSCVDGIIFDKQKTSLLHYPIGREDVSYAVSDGITTIGDFAFCGCEYIERIELPASVTTVGMGSFSSCPELKKIDVTGDSLKSIGGVLFDADGRTLIAYPAGLKESHYIIPNGVTTIGDIAFEGCENLKKITIPTSVTTIGDDAFADCSSMIEITLPESVKTLGIRAFSGCKALTSVNLSSNIKVIEEATFAECENLKSINFPEGIKTIKESAFAFCRVLEQVTIPDSVTNISNRAFDNNVTSIDGVAFDNSDILTIYVSRKNSYAYEYAVENNIKFKVTGEVSFADRVRMLFSGENG